MFYAHEFWFRTTHRVLDSVEELDCDERVREAVVVFVHAEAEDEEQYHTPIGVVHHVHSRILYLDKILLHH